MISQERREALEKKQMDLTHEIQRQEASFYQDAAEIKRLKKERLVLKDLMENVSRH